MDSTDAFLKLLEEEAGTYLLRENSRKELRLSVRSQLPNDYGQESDSVKLVGHIALRKDETGFGWFAGSGRNERKEIKYDSFYDIIRANKEKGSIYQFKSHYKN